MKATRLFAHVGAAATLLGLAVGQALATPLPVDDFAKIPAIQSVTMSPDGKQLVAIIAAREATTVTPRSPTGTWTISAQARWPSRPPATA